MFKTETRVSKSEDGKFKVEVVSSVEAKRPLNRRQFQTLNSIHSSNMTDRQKNDAISAYLSSLNGNKRTAMLSNPSLYDVVNKFRNRNRVHEFKMDMLAQKQKGEIFNRYLAKFDPTKSKQPVEGMYLGEYIGVEIECFIPYGSMGLDSLEERDCDDCGGSGVVQDSDGDDITCGTCDGSGVTGGGDEDSMERPARNFLKAEIIKRRIANVQFKGDGSIDCDTSEYFPIEFTVLMLKDDRKPLERLCKMLNDLGAEVNKSCGLHVHLDQRDLYIRSDNDYDKQEVTIRANRLGNALGLLASMVPAPRRNNDYCLLQVSGFSSDRYSAINKTALYKYGTIEIRLHSASTNYKKINNWVSLLLLLSRTEGVDNMIQDADDLVEAIPEIDENLLSYIVSRVELFKSKKSLRDSNVSDDEDFAVA